MTAFFKKYVQRETGQSMVEFALVLPFFIILLFGIMEFGRIWETVNVMTSAAREGARIAAIDGSGSYKATQATTTVLNNGQIDNASIHIEGPNAADEITVTVNVTYTPLTGSIVPGVGTIPLTRRTTMHWEG